MFEQIRLAVEENVALITLNRPDVMNAASPSMIRELNLALDEIQILGSEVRCISITGAGKAFCAGANLRADEADVKGPQPHDAGRDLELAYNPLFKRLRALPLPFVTVVNGPAVGVGVSLALMGDLILCSRNAYFLHAFRNIGLVPDGGATWLLPRLIGRARAMELSLLGERLSADTAYHWGFVNRVCDDKDLLPEALTLTRKLATGPTLALGLTRYLYWESGHQAYEDQLRMERECQRTAGESSDFREGIGAFREKRAPKFTGK